MGEEEVHRRALRRGAGDVGVADDVLVPQQLAGHRLSTGAAELEELDGLGTFVERTEGVSASFIRELMRRAALVAADEEGAIQVRDRHLDTALKELMLDSNALTQSLLGVTTEEERKARRPSC